MGLDDLVNKGKHLFTQNQDKITEALKSERAEGISDKLLDGASSRAKKMTSGKYDEHIDKARNSADKSVGNE
jgi:hypothetical protein